MSTAIIIIICTNREDKKNLNIQAEIADFGQGRPNCMMHIVEVTLPNIIGGGGNLKHLKIHKKLSASMLKFV